MFHRSLIAIYAALLLTSSTAAQADDDEYSNGNPNYLNVYGGALQPCSSDGMALTGYMRTGYCVDEQDDSGSHHICIDLSSLGGNANNQNFCDVTGQSDWCSAEDMPCHEDLDSYGCPVTDWCVCQWAFASYIQKSGGCENIQTIVCESINMEALKAYQKMTNKWNAEQKYIDALDCLVDRCGLDASQFKSYGTISSMGSPPVGFTLFVILGIAASTVVVLHVFRKSCGGAQKIDLNNECLGPANNEKGKGQTLL